MRNRSPATKDAAAAGSTPMNSAPVMNRSPRMPPRPLGSGQLFGWGRADRAAASKSTASGQSEQARAAPFRHGAQGEVPAPCGERQKQDDRGEPQGLHGEIGEDRAPRPKHVAGRGLGRVVEARVVDRPGGEARPCRAGNRRRCRGRSRRNMNCLKPDSTAPGKSLRRSFCLRLVAIAYPNVATMRSKASPVVSGSCTSATLTWFRPGLTPLAPVRAR